MAKKPWWHGDKANWRTIEIEDDSDCDTCTRRNADEWAMLQTVRCNVLQGLTCPECGREISILTEAE